MDFSLGSISMLIAQKDDFSSESIFKTSLPYSITEDITHSGRLKARGVEKIIERAGEALSMAENFSCSEIHAVSTTLLRSISNAEEVAKKLEEASSLHLTSLSGEEEAYAAYYANEKYKILEKALLIDIGGSSTELCDYGKAYKEAMVSLPDGAESFADEYLEDMYPSREEKKRITESLLKLISENDLKAIGRYENAVITGSNSEALYKVYKIYYGIDERHDERLMQKKKLKKLIKALMDETKRKNLLLRCVPEKSHLLIVYAIMLKTILSHYGICNITVSSVGVKEGVFRLITEGRLDSRATFIGENNERG